MGRHSGMHFQLLLLISLLFVFNTLKAWGQAQDKPQPKPGGSQSASGPPVTARTGDNRSTTAAAIAKKAAADSESTEADEEFQFDKEEEKDGSDEILKRAGWFYKQRSNLNGQLPPGARAVAYEHMQKMMMAEGKLKQRVDGTYAAVTAQGGSSTGTWTSIGPTPTLGGVFGPVTGRITTIAVDPSDSTGSTVLIGGAQGGIWRTTDAGLTWKAVGDQNASLAMGSIAFAPSQSATVYAGTGEQAGIGFDIYYGAGVLVSSDHGQTWKQTCTVASTTCPFIGPYSNMSPFGYFTLGGTRISYVSVNPNNPQMVLVGAQTQFSQGPTEGVYCSDNGGQTWTNVLPDEMSTFVGFASSSMAYAAFGNPYGSSSGQPNGNGIYKATAIGANCSTIHFVRLLSTSLPLQSSMGRIELGIAPSDSSGNTVYASIADGTTASAKNLGVYVTTDGGTNWVKSAAPDVCQNQCWYDNVIKVDPNNKQIAFFGGSSVSNNGAPNWVVRTMDGGTTWGTVLPNLSVPNGGLPHVDSHALAFAKLPSGKVRVYLGNDGGIWRTDDAEAASVAWTNLNGSTLTLTQFYPAISIHPSTPVMALGGTQDNGTQTYSGNTSWADLNICGDGTGTAIDAVIPSTVYIACNGANLLASYQSGATGTFSPAVNGINPADYSSFVPPFVVDPQQANVLYLGTTQVYRSVDAGSSWTVIQGDLVNGNNGDALTALGVAPTNSKVVYAGATTGDIFVTSDATISGNFHGVAGQNNLPPRTVTAIAVDPADLTGQTAYAAYSGFSYVLSTASVPINDRDGHIFKTTNQGATWTDASCSVSNCQTPGPTDLPNLPVNDIVVDPDVPGTLYAATDLGVFVGNCTFSPCTWSTLGAGLPRVAVLSLKLHEASRTLRAATHGRGVWDIVLTNFSFPAGPHITSISPTSANAGGSAFTLTVNGGSLTGGIIQLGATALTTVGTPSDTTISGTVPTNLLTTGTPFITVKTSGSTSNGLKFSVAGPAPTLTSINPTSTPIQAAPGTSVTVTLTGTNFTSGSKVFWNGEDKNINVKFNGPTSLTATLPSAIIGSFGSTNDISVQDPPPGGGNSQAVAFKVVAPAPANDNFANAINITDLNYSDTKDSSGASTEGSDPIPPCVHQYSSAVNTGGHPNGTYNSIWYKFTPQFSANMDLGTIGSLYDSVLSVWTGTQGNLLSVACNDDVVPGNIIQSQLLQIPLTAGTTYYFMVSSFGPPDPNPVALGGVTLFQFMYNGGQAPTPVITSLTPSTIPSGNPTFTLTVNGSNFLNTAFVDWDGNMRATTFVNSTQLTVQIPASDVILPGTYSLMVFNPPATQSASTNYTVTVGTYPAPTLSSLGPNSGVAGVAPFGMTISGTNIASNATVKFNGISENTSILAPTTIFTNIGIPESANPGTVQVTVTNPSPGGGTASLPFTLTQPNPVPTITSLNPNSAAPGSQITTTITGTGFTSGAVALFNNSYLNTTFLSSTQLTVDLTGLLNSAGTYQIIVRDLPPGGQSAPATFSVTGPPDFAIAAQGTTALTVSAGQTATFTNAINVTALNGFSAAVTLSCTIPATASTCSISPSSLPMGSGTATVLVTTTSRALLPPSSPWNHRMEWPRLLLFGVAAMLAFLLMLRFRRTALPRMVSALPLACFVLLLIMQLTGCGGGGGGGNPPPPPHGTPAGTYVITVTGISGTTTHTQLLQLSVN
jgi:hypothetical protein